MDLSSSSFVNDTMDSMDSFFSSPADKGANSAAKNIVNAGQGAVDSAVEKVSKTVSAEVDMATEKATGLVTEGDTGPKSLTDLNDNQFFENVKSSLYEEVDEKKEVIQVELNSAIGSTDLNAVSERIGASTVVNGVGEQVSEKFDEVKSVVPGEPLVSETSSGSRAAGVKVDTSADSTEVKTAEKDDDVFVVVKDAAMAAVADVQGGASVEDAAKKAVTNVVANVSPNVSAGLSRLSGGGSPLPTESTESRDNPFIPDGDLSKETDELLKRATIIRDKFYLDQQEKQQKALADIDTTDNVAVENVPVQESAVAPVAAQPAHSQAKGSQPATAEVKPRMRENGKVEDSVSPEGVKPEVEKGAVAPNADVSKTSPDASGENDNEKKKQKKCCNIM